MTKHTVKVAVTLFMPTVFMGYACIHPRTGETLCEPTVSAVASETDTERMASLDSGGGDGDGWPRMVGHPVELNPPPAHGNHALGSYWRRVDHVEVETAMDGLEYLHAFETVVPVVSTYVGTCTHRVLSRDIPRFRCHRWRLCRRTRGRGLFVLGGPKRRSQTAARDCDRRPNVGSERGCSLGDKLTADPKPAFVAGSRRATESLNPGNPSHACRSQKLPPVGVHPANQLSTSPS